MRAITILAVVASLALWGLAGCGSDAEGVSVNANGVAAVDTLVTPASIIAGQTATIECRAADIDGQLIPNLSFSATILPVGGSPLAGMTITGRTAGTYDVACEQDGIVDDTPAPFTVTPAQAVRTTMALNPSTTRVNEPTTIDCQAFDAYGNHVVPTISVKPDPGVTLNGGTLTTDVAGTYEVACDAPGVSAQATGTAAWVVLPGEMTGLKLVLTPEAPAWPMEAPITVNGVGLDVHGNEIPDVALTGIDVTPGDQHLLVGDPPTMLRFSREGIYTVRATARDDARLTATVQLVIDQTGPHVTIDSPERGLVTDTLTSVTVSGVVSDNLGAMSAVIINGESIAVPPAGGAFSTEVPLDYGLTILDIQAVDLYDNVRQVTRAAERSIGFYEMVQPAPETDSATNALVMILMPEVIDDGVRDEPDPDDLASVFKIIIDTLDLGALLPNPLSTFSCINGECHVVFSELTFSKSAVTLALVPGRLKMTATLDDLAATVTLFAPCNIGPPVCATNPAELPGTFSTDKVTMTTDIVVYFVEGQIQARAENTTVTMDGFNVKINDPTGILQGIIDIAVVLIEEGLIDAMQLMFGRLIEGQLGEALSALFNALALNTTFDVPSPVEGQPGNEVTLETWPSGIEISPERLQLRMDGLAYAVAPQRPAPSLGSLGRDGCAPYEALTFPPSQPVALGLHDDFINQLLFAVWEGGTLSLDVGPGEGDSLVAGFGIAGLELEVRALLPPIFNSCEGPDRLQIGDLYVKASFMLVGQPVNLELWLGAEALVTVEFAPNAEGGLTGSLNLGDLEPLLLEVVTNEGLFEGDEKGIEDLLKDQLVPRLLETLSDSAKLELPKIDLGALTPGIPAGTVINIDVREISRDGGYLGVFGGLK